MRFSHVGITRTPRSRDSSGEFQFDFPARSGIDRRWENKSRFHFNKGFAGSSSTAFFLRKLKLRLMVVVWIPTFLCFPSPPPARFGRNSTRERHRYPVIIYHKSNVIAILQCIYYLRSNIVDERLFSMLFNDFVMKARQPWRRWRLRWAPKRRRRNEDQNKRTAAGNN